MNLIKLEISDMLKRKSTPRKLPRVTSNFRLTPTNRITRMNTPSNLKIPRKCIDDILSTPKAYKGTPKAISKILSNASPKLDKSALPK